MGCCISKCRPKRKKQSPMEECSRHVQDKLVISQPPKTPKLPNPLSLKVSPSPPSPTTSTSSLSSFTCTNSNTTSTCSSLSTRSSTISSKDRSFSNDFLWSCIKENPHIIRINSIKECSQLLVSPNAHARKLEPSPAAKQFVAPPKQSIAQRINGSTMTTPRKRARSSSPTTLTRQKSFCRDLEELNSSYSQPRRRSLRSPSPSGRFNVDSSRGILGFTSYESCSRGMAGSQREAASSISSPLRKDNLKPFHSQCNNPSKLHWCLRSRETCIHRISSKIDEVAVGDALAHHGTDSIPMEDIHNPLISLDCFIFL